MRVDTDVVVSFDYGCPFSYVAHRWLVAAGPRVDFQPFSLAELHRLPGALPVWQVPIDRLDPVVLSLAAHELVRQVGGDVDAYRTEMFAFWHEESHRTFDGLLQIVESHLGETVTMPMVSRGLAAVKTAHQTAAASGVFGTPTVRFSNQASFYLKLSSLPDDAGSAKDLWRHLEGLAVGHPSLVELKRSDIAV